MKLVRYDKNGALRLGALDGEHVVDLLDACPVGTPPALLAALSDAVKLVAAAAAGLKVVRAALDNARRTGAGRNAADKAKLAAPIMPTLLLCSGENYWDHRDEKPEVARKDPEFFTKTALGVIGPGDDIIRDERVTKKLDYETELAIVIGKPGRHIPVERALEHVYGYTIVNDVTARDRQVTLRPDGSSVYNLGPGKHFNT
ncbi:MAG: fumarylacetoacetate hydrolase family protein, partial [Pseudomonadota bacterium]